MRLPNILRVHAFDARRPSYGVFSPKDARAEATLLREIAKTVPYEPRFINIATTGAFPDHLENLRLARTIELRFNIPTVVHLPFGLLSLDSAKRIAESIARLSLENVMIVRGHDPDPGFGASTFPHANDAIAWMQQTLPTVSIAGACYPDKHPEARDDDEDRKHTELRVHAGAETLFAQVSYDPLESYVCRVSRDPLFESIRAPIVPLIPLFDKQSFVMKFMTKSGVNIPFAIRQNLVRCPSWERQARWALHVEFVARQLLEVGIHSLHFETFNEFTMFHHVWKNLLQRWEPPTSEDRKRAFLNP